MYDLLKPPPQGKLIIPLFYNVPFSILSVFAGAFLIPYIVMLLFAGLPLFFLELCFGQYSSSGPISAWRSAPLMKGQYPIYIRSFLFLSPFCLFL